MSNIPDADHAAAATAPRAAARVLRVAVAGVLLAAAPLALAQTLLPPPKEPLLRATPRAAPQPQQVVPGQPTRLQTRPLPGGVGVFGHISRRAAELLGRSEYAAASWQACIYDAVRQGIPIAVAITLCEIKLWQDDQRGWGDAGIASAVFRQPPPPPNAVGACASAADPRLAAGKLKDNPYGNVGDRTLERLLKATSEAAAREPDPAQQALLKNAARQMKNELQDREETNKAVPDPAPPVAPSPGPGASASGAGASDGKKATSPESVCVQALAQAQEFLRECQRTGWKTGACQTFQAREKGCPDPRLAYVDPGAGYACGDGPDPKLVAEAYARRCEQLVRFGPDGSNPCRPKAPELDVRAIKGVKDLCNDPKAYHTGEGCVVELVAPSPAGFQRGGTVQEVITIATSRLGGPIFVLPKPAPAPRGPQPMPGPAAPR